MSAVNDLINYSKQWTGYLEKTSMKDIEDKTKNAGFNNITIFAEWYKDIWGKNYQGQPWCAMFVSTVFYKCFGVELFNHFSYCPEGVNIFKRMGEFYSYPMKGDIIFFTNGTRAYHTGIVTMVQNGKVYTIEGNTSNRAGVDENGGCVAEKSYSLGYNKILGYGRPKYERIDKMIDELKQEINQLKNENIKLTERINKLENPMIYNYIDDNMPEYARNIIAELVNKGVLKGDDNGLNLDDNMLRTIVIMQRMINNK